VRRNDEVAAQRRRWTFYEAIKASCQPNRPLIVLSIRKGKLTETRHGKPAGEETKQKEQAGHRQTGRRNKMKKIVMVLLAALFAWAVAQPAEAGRERGGAFLLGLGLGILLVPPLIHAASPPVVYEPHYPPPPAAKYGRYDNPRPEKAWVPGHWAKRWNGYHRVWERAWIPGHWRYYQDP